MNEHDIVFIITNSILNTYSDIPVIIKFINNNIIGKFIEVNQWKLNPLKIDYESFFSPELIQYYTNNLF